MSEHDEIPDASEGTPLEQEQELPELDVIDPLKRDAEDDDERMPGMDPVVAPVPPE